MAERDRSFPPAVLRWSELKHMGTSAAHFRAAYEEPQEQTAPLGLGSLVHGILFGDSDIVTYEAERRGNAWKEFRSANAGKTIVTLKERALADRIVAAVRAHPVAKLMRGKAEHELRWRMHGRECGARVDLLANRWIYEVKTSRCAEPGWFTRQGLRLGYHGQVAWQYDGARANGHMVEGVKFVVVETRPPFPVTVLTVSARALEHGRKLGRLLVERVVACEAANAWPPYVQSEVEFDVVENQELNFDDLEAAE